MYLISTYCFRNALLKSFGKELCNISTNELDILAHDKAIFIKSNVLMSESDLRIVTEGLLSDDSYYNQEFKKVREWMFFFEEKGNQYLSKELKEASENLLQSTSKLSGFLATHFFIYPSGQNTDNVRFCMYPDWNIDRGGHFKDREKYDEFQSKLDDVVRDVNEKYDTYRTVIKSKLII